MTANTEPDAPASRVERQFHAVEIAHLMGVQVRTVRGWLCDPDHPLAGTKIGRQWYVPESKLKKFLQGGK